MIGLLCLCDTALPDVHRVLTGQGIATELLMPETVLAGKKANRKLQCVLLPSVSLFIKRADELLDWPGVVIIFDAPVRCDGLVGATLLDVKERTESFRYVFERLAPDTLVDAVRQCIEDEEEVMFHVRQSNLIPYLLNQTSASQMDRVQTWKYVIKNTELRDQAMSKLVEWFFVPKPTVDQLRKKLATMLSVAEDRLDVLFRDNRFADLKKATLVVAEAKAKGKSVSVDKVAEDNGVSPFDIRYLMNAYAKLQKHDGDLNPPIEIREVQKAARYGTPCPLKAQLEGDPDDADTEDQ